MYPHLRASFIAVSTASAPVFMGSTMSYVEQLFMGLAHPQDGAITSVMNLAKTPKTLLWKALELSVNLCACSVKRCDDPWMAMSLD